ncbi:type VI-B CRISPR accessory protein Csx27 [Capnocytophaga cynodegmi]|uniref:type VI-B CRISPR accessory protein Csx27 n=1 Tax=Capnocytophaga cynodegmi TaxID=28189 RepID=UPI00385986E2
MDRLSIYELLSFVVPGVIMIELMNFSAEYVFGKAPLITAGNLSEGLLFFAIALSIGCLIHIITFRLIKRKWYKKLACTPMDKMKNDEYITEILPDLKEIYRANKGIPMTENISNESVFDTAYYYLEAQGKISQAKNFQSIYFLFRNIVTLSLFVLPVSVIFFLASLFMKDCLLSLKIIGIIIGTFVLGGLSSIVAQWFRVKMTDRIFGLYYAELTHHKK